MGLLTQMYSAIAVAPAAPAPPAEDEGLAAAHVGHNLAGFGLPDQGAPGDVDGEGLAVPAGLPAPLAVGAVSGGIFALIAEVHQGGHMVVHLEDDGAAPAAVAAVGAACGDVFLPVEGDGAVAAGAGFDRDFCFINKS